MITLATLALLLASASPIKAYSSVIAKAVCTQTPAWFDGPYHGAPFSVTNTVGIYTTTLATTTAGVTTVTASTTSTVITGISTIRVPTATVTVTVHGSAGASAASSPTTSAPASPQQKRRLEKRFNFIQTSCVVSVTYMTSGIKTIPSSTVHFQPTLLAAATTTLLQGTTTVTATEVETHSTTSTGTTTTKANVPLTTSIAGGVYYLVPTAAVTKATLSGMGYLCAATSVLPGF